MPNSDEIATSVIEESELTPADVEELERLLNLLQTELETYHDHDDLTSLGGTGYKRVIRAPSGITAVKRYVDWREKQRTELR